MAVQAKFQTDELVAQNKVVERIGEGFADGVCSGYLTYYDEYQSKPLTDLDVYAFIHRLKHQGHSGCGCVQCWLLYRLD